MLIYSPLLSGSSIVEGTLNVSSGITGSLLGTSSYAVTASYYSGSVGNSISASYASSSTSASYALFAETLTTGSKIINGDLNVIGTITAKEIHTTLVTSSVLYESGSSRFGDSLDDTHQFTGSLSITGSLTLNGSKVITTDQTASMSVTASVSSSFASSSVSASYALTASYLEGAVDVFPYTGSAVISGSLQVTGSINDLLLGGGKSGNGISIGTGSLANNIGAYNIGIGESALEKNTSGLGSVALGYQALQSSSTANGNVALGYQSQKSTTTGGSNFSIGPLSLSSNTTGNENIAIGNGSLQTNIIGAKNTAIGTYALNVATVSGNVAVGTYSLQKVTTGGYNTALGVDTGFNLTTGTNNVMLGASSSLALTTGGNNTAVGWNSLAGTTVGGTNTAVGYQAGRYISGSTTNNGGATNSIYIGYDTRPLSNNQPNQIVIGYTAIGLGSNSTVIGNSSTTKALIWGNTTISGSLTASSITGSIGVNFTQSSPSTTWTINHNLNNQHPLVQVYGADHNMVIPTNISGSSTNQIIVTFSTAFAGYARVL